MKTIFNILDSLIVSCRYADIKSIFIRKTSGGTWFGKVHVAGGIIIDIWEDGTFNVSYMEV